MKSSKNKIDLLQLKPGNVLIAQEFWNNELFNRAVILILKHDEDGSAGIILNKSNVVLQNIETYKKNILRGQPFGLNNTGILCKLKNISKNENLAEIYEDGNFARLRKMIFDGAHANNAKNFVVLTAWESGQLEQQLVERKWWVTEFSIQDLYEVDNANLWEYKLIQSKNLYGLFGDLPDPLSN